MSKKYSDSHPNPDAKLWKILINPDKSQETELIKEMSITNSLGDSRKMYIHFNSNGDLIALEVDHQPEIQAPDNIKNTQSGFVDNFKLPTGMGLFPPYKVLVTALKTALDGQDNNSKKG